MSDIDECTEVLSNMANHFLRTRKYYIRNAIKRSRKFKKINRHYKTGEAFIYFNGGQLDMEKERKYAHKYKKFYKTIYKSKYTTDMINFLKFKNITNYYHN